MPRTPPLLEWWKRVVFEAEKKRAARATEGSEHVTGLWPVVVAETKSSATRKKRCFFRGCELFDKTPKSI